MLSKDREYLVVSELARRTPVRWARALAEPVQPPGETLMASERIKILYIIDYFHRTGGTERHLAHLIAGLPAEQFRCSVVTFDLGENPLLDGLRARGVPIINLPVGAEYTPNAVLQALRLRRLIRNGRYDIVQTFHRKADTYGALIARFAGAKYLRLEQTRHRRGA